MNLSRNSLALGLTLVVVLISVFLAVIGSPYSEVSVTACPAGGPACAQTETYSTLFVPISLAAIPLLIAAMIGIGLIINRLIFSWVGSIALMAFSLITGFSIGLFYIPCAIGLIALLAANRSHRVNATLVK
jgi:hypothetical protein